MNNMNDEDENEKYEKDSANKNDMKMNRMINN